MSKINHNRTNISLKLFIAIVFMIGFMIFMYPFFANAVNNYVAQREVNSINQINQKASDKKLKELIAANKKKTEENQQLGISPVKNILGTSLKNVPKEDQSYYWQHDLGSIFIPKISLSLPIFDTTTESLLQQGITLLPGSSYPVGGNNTHTVLLGHSGLTSQLLFTNLHKLKIGDKFFFKVYGKRLAYQVISKKVVLPTNLNDVGIKANEDLATLVTCTPYMINTHRLLVTGKRVPLSKTAFDRQENQTSHYQTNHLLSLLILFVIVGSIICFVLKRELIDLLASKRYYLLQFYVYKNHLPVSDLSFRLVQNNGKPLFNQQGDVYRATSDKNGQVDFGKLSGGRYKILIENLMTNEKPFCAYVKKLGSKLFYLKKIKRSNYQIILESNQKND
ncbi:MULTISPECIES: class C sortase [Leuconostoc gelidum group]|uniref:Class C sortase n=1 Tax=Leuconostoc gelidum subsp. gelidum TaxID=1607839 RepID=A0AB35G1X8_LEUGE|nr:MULTISPECIES: class C sortase [Leuconostoc gelidum group]MBZ5960312.1 class C sortase [Leuconostoc gasicomitatum]MBZ5968815.1 class C sortase [Leuconostoc gasicomitatum]MBZ6016787.1 class C sortase [Leuconostoc gelidum subsp. gelidum]